MRSCAHEVPTVYILRVKNDLVHNVEKGEKKNNLTITSKSYAYPHTMKKRHAKFHNNWYKTVRGVALTRGTNCLHIKDEKWLRSQCGKSDNDLTIISKPYAHPHTMKKTYAKFQNNRYKTVRGVALTRGTHCLYIEGEKWLSSQCGKSDKNVLTIIPKPYAHPHTMKKTHATFQNNEYKTVRGFALTRGTHCLYIEVKND